MESNKKKQVIQLLRDYTASAQDAFMQIRKWRESPRYTREGTIPDTEMWYSLYEFGYYVKPVSEPEFYFRYNLDKLEGFDYFHTFDYYSSRKDNYPDLELTNEELDAFYKELEKDGVLAMSATTWRYNWADKIPANDVYLLSEEEKDIVENVRNFAMSIDENNAAEKRTELLIQLKEASLQIPFERWKMIFFREIGHRMGPFSVVARNIVADLFRSGGYFYCDC